jgi:hypothetical protein
VIHSPLGVSLWKNIGSGWDKLERFLSFKVDNGARTRFWLLAWFGDSFQDYIARDKEAFVAAHL